MRLTDAGRTIQQHSRRIAVLEQSAKHGLGDLEILIKRVVLDVAGHVIGSPQRRPRRGGVIFEDVEDQSAACFCAASSAISRRSSISFTTASMHRSKSITV